MADLLGSIAGQALKSLASRTTKTGADLLKGGFSNLPTYRNDPVSGLPATTSSLPPPTSIDDLGSKVQAPHLDTNLFIPHYIRGDDMVGSLNQIHTELVENQNVINKNVGSLMNYLKETTTATNARIDKVSQRVTKLESQYKTIDETVNRIVRDKNNLQNAKPTFRHPHTSTGSGSSGGGIGLSAFLGEGVEAALGALAGLAPETILAVAAAVPVIKWTYNNWNTVEKYAGKIEKGVQDVDAALNKVNQESQKLGQQFRQDWNRFLAFGQHLGVIGDSIKTGIQKEYAGGRALFEKQLSAWKNDFTQYVTKEWNDGGAEIKSALLRELERDKADLRGLYNELKNQIHNLDKGTKNTQSQIKGMYDDIHKWENQQRTIQANPSILNQQATNYYFTDPNQSIWSKLWHGTQTAPANVPSGPNQSLTAHYSNMWQSLGGSSGSVNLPNAPSPIMGPYDTAPISPLSTYSPADLIAHMQAITSSVGTSPVSSATSVPQPTPSADNPSVLNQHGTVYYFTNESQSWWDKLLHGRKTAPGNVPTGPNDSLTAHYNNMQNLGGSAGPAKPGEYRPIYNLQPADTSDAVVDTIAGEVSTKNQAGVDAVINNMFNRIHGKGYANTLYGVARQPGQYAGFRKASPQEAAYIRSRIKAIASGQVPDNTNGATEYRAASYTGPWAQKHQDGPIIGGNRFGTNERALGGMYESYSSPKTPASGSSSSSAIDQHISRATQINKMQIADAVTSDVPLSGTTAGAPPTNLQGMLKASPTFANLYAQFQANKTTRNTNETAMQTYNRSFDSIKGDTSYAEAAAAAAHEATFALQQNDPTEAFHTANGLVPGVDMNNLDKMYPKPYQLLKGSGLNDGSGGFWKNYMSSDSQLSGDNFGGMLSEINSYTNQSRIMREAGVSQQEVYGFQGQMAALAEYMNRLSPSQREQIKAKYGKTIATIWNNAQDALGATVGHRKDVLAAGQKDIYGAYLKDPSHFAGINQVIGGSVTQSPHDQSPQNVHPSDAPYAAARAKFRQEVANNPGLALRLRQIAMNEAGDEKGQQAIIESLLNRAYIRGHSVEQEAQWHVRGGKGYYQQGRGVGANVPVDSTEGRAVQLALAGSDISQGATDNASGGLAAKDEATGAFTHRIVVSPHGDQMFRPGSANPRDAQNYYKLLEARNESSSGAIDAVMHKAVDSPGGDHTNSGGDSRNPIAQGKDSTGRTIPSGLQKQLAEMATNGDRAGIRRVLAEHGYHGDSADCAEYAQAMAQAGGYKGMGSGYTMASNWQRWGRAAMGSEANSKDLRLGGMMAVSTVHTYGAGVGTPIHPGQSGGHIQPVIPGSYDPKTNTVEVYSPDPARKKRIPASGHGYELRIASDDKGGKIVPITSAASDHQAAKDAHDAGSHDITQPSRAVRAVNHGGTIGSGSISNHPAFTNTNSVRRTRSLTPTKKEVDRHTEGVHKVEHTTGHDPHKQALLDTPHKRPYIPQTKNNPEQRIPGIGDMGQGQQSNPDCVGICSVNA